MSATNVPWLVLALVALSVVELAKTARWRVMFGPAQPAYSRCLRALVAGQIANALSPVRAGEAVRLGLITAEGGSLVTAAAALAAAQAMDSISLAAIAAAVLGAAALGSSTTGLAAAALVLLAGVALALRGQRLRPFLERNRLTRKLRLAAILDVAATLRDPRALVAVGMCTLLVWVSGMAANWFVMAGVGVTPTIDLAARVIVVGYVFAWFPAPPGRLGVFEAGVTAALTSGGVPLAEAIAAGVTLHALQLVELGLLFAVSIVATRRWRTA